MVIIHADGKTATNLNRFDRIKLHENASGNFSILAGRDDTVAEIFVRRDETEAQEQFDIIVKEWAMDRKCYDLRIPIAFYADKENE